MVDLAVGLEEPYLRFARSQDRIGWRRFMEGMVSKEVLSIQRDYAGREPRAREAHSWIKGLILKLLETTHGQWLYRNVQVHDVVSGSLATAKKEELQRLIEEQLAMGEESLEEEDRYLLEVNLEDLETTSGESQTYWLLAIQAAREAAALRTVDDDTVVVELQGGARA